MVTMPALDGSVAVEHRYVDLGDDVTIHVADAGPADGPAVMLVHGFPENWWEWHELIGPLAADGYRAVLLRRIRANAGATLAYETSVESALDALAEHLERCLDLDHLLRLARQPTG